MAALRMSREELDRLLATSHCRVSGRLHHPQAERDHPQKPVRTAGEKRCNSASVSEERMPQRILFNALVDRYTPEPMWEYKGCVEGRRFRADIAYPELNLVIEVEGWQFHGKHKGAFIKDHERRNQFAIHGWRMLGFSAGRIHSDLERVLAEIRDAARTLQPRRHSDEEDPY